MLDEKTRADLQREYEMLSERANSSKAEAEQIRSALKEKQALLNSTESSLVDVHNQIQALEAELASVSTRLESARTQATQQQSSLQSIHQEMATLAQSLGPVAQKQKRFEEALAMVEQNLGAMDSSAKAPPPPPPPPQVLVSPPATPTPPAPPAAVDDSQRSVRKDLELNLSFEIDLGQGSEHNFYTGLTNNISEGGVFISTSQVLDIGTKIRFPLNLPGMLEGEMVEGEVRWVRGAGRAEENVPPGVGVQFTVISNSLRARINNYLDQRESIFYED